MITYGNCKLKELAVRSIIRNKQQEMDDTLWALAYSNNFLVSSPVRTPVYNSISDQIWFADQRITYRDNVKNTHDVRSDSSWGEEYSWGSECLGTKWGNWALQLQEFKICNGHRSSTGEHKDLQQPMSLNTLGTVLVVGIRRLIFLKDYKASGEPNASSHFTLEMP